jgi:hypothetical protein
MNTGRIPGKRGLTKEAAEALRAQAGMPTDPIVTDLDEDAEDNLPFDVSIGPPQDFGTDFETGDDIPDEPKLRTKAEPPPPARDAKASIPTIDEWSDFWSRIVLRVACDWYIEWAFRGVDENSLTDREIERVQMSTEERQRIGTPLAEFSHKSKFMRKHGRTIVASGGMFDGIVAIGTWTSRVNRIARKHKPQTVQGRVIPNERTGQGEPRPNGPGYEGANGGRVGDGFTIINPGG